MVRLRPLSRDEVRALDEFAISALGIPSMVLMENAGRGAAKVLDWAMHEWRQNFPIPARPNVLVVCGPGNNGGDGAVVARHLDSAGLAHVKLVWTVPPERLRGDAPAQFRILRESGIDQTHCAEPSDLALSISEADWIVDGLFGTGLTRALDDSSAAGTIVKMINASGKPVLALDLPSGLDADSGKIPGVAVRATVTATFVAPKIGFYEPLALEWTGHVEIVDIGLPRSALRRFESNAS
jgi:NAD(P)H-hydrate epimerase